MDWVDSIIEDTVVIDACDHTLGQAFKKGVYLELPSRWRDGERVYALRSSRLDRGQRA